MEGTVDADVPSCHHLVQGREFDDFHVGNYTVQSEGRTVESLADLTYAEARHD